MIDRLACLVCLAVLALSVACAADQPKEPEQPPQSSQPPPRLDYQGPKVAAALAGSELEVSIHVSTGGHGLVVKGTQREGDHTTVKLGLTAPGEGEEVTEGFEFKRVKVVLPAESGPIHVRVQQVQRGVEYFVEPEYHLAAVVAR